jgi:hypothetical protein
MPPIVAAAMAASAIAYRWSARSAAFVAVAGAAARHPAVLARLRGRSHSHLLSPEQRRRDAAAARAAASRQPSLPSQSVDTERLASMVQTLARLGQRPEESWMDMFLAACQANLNFFTGSQLSRTIWGLAKLQQVGASLGLPACPPARQRPRRGRPCGQPSQQRLRPTRTPPPPLGPAPCCRRRRTTGQTPCWPTCSSSCRRCQLPSSATPSGRWPRSRSSPRGPGCPSTCRLVPASPTPRPWCGRPRRGARRAGAQRCAAAELQGRPAAGPAARPAARPASPLPPRASKVMHSCSRRCDPS